MYINEDAVKSSKRIIYVAVGFGIVVIAFLFWLNAFVSTYSGYVTILNMFLMPVAVFSISAGLKRGLMHTELNNYRAIIGMKPVMSFMEIGEQVGRSPEDVFRDFEWMNGNNFFENVYIDHKKYCITFGILPNKGVKAVKKQMIAHICEYCCGTTMIEKGKDGVCDWCRGPIESDR